MSGPTCGPGTTAQLQEQRTVLGINISCRFSWLVKSNTVMIILDHISLQPILMNALGQS